ncbi:MAG: glycosyl hydrolase 115 family protein [Lachnospiraceae bacterium]
MEFILKNQSQVATFYYEAEAFSGVNKIADKVREDVFRVTGLRPKKVTSLSDMGNSCVCFATIGKSPLLDRLVSEGLADIRDMEGKREVYGWFLLENKLAGVEKLLLIVGSDKRGTIYGLFHMSDIMGVSAFVDWSDVIPRKQEQVILDGNCFGISKEPSVWYRGFFINDEWPAFGNWCGKHFGGINAKMYEHIFEVLLRLKGNYLWPAMWASCFALDGPDLKSAELADEYGIIMGTSHHEPCLRHGDEYRRVRGKDSIYGDAWDFSTNEAGITRFWKDGLNRNGHMENVITIGMRGERDSAIMGGRATLKDNIDLLKNVISTQHRLIRECVNEDLSQVPRMLALYKEVEPFYYGDRDTEGLKDWKELEDVILMLCDDNHGYLRTLPDEKMREHPGGYGMYYHFDYHGEPVSYEWTNSSYLPQVWEQMTMAYEYGVRKLWIVNVGDLGLQEFPLSFFMDLAYDYDKWGINALNTTPDYTKQWVRTQFASAFDEKDIEEIAVLIEKYTHISHNRRPEHMGADIYHPVHYKEAWKVLCQAEEIISGCDRLLTLCREESKPAFYELVYYNAVATMNLHKMWIYSSFNHFLAERGAIAANFCGDKVRECVAEDRRLQQEFNQMADGKWDGLALAKHIGFNQWNAEERKNPVIHTVLPLEEPCLIVGVCNSEAYTYGGEWTGKKLRMDDFCNPAVDTASFYLASGSDIPVEYSISCDSDWIEIRDSKGCIRKEEPLVICEVKCNRDKLRNNAKEQAWDNDKKAYKATIHIKSGENDICMEVFAKTDLDIPEKIYPIINGYTVIDSKHFAGKKDTAEGRFVVLEKLARDSAGIKAFPVTKDFRKLPADAVPYVEYLFETCEDGQYKVYFYLEPTNPVYHGLEMVVRYSANGGRICEEPIVDENYMPGVCKVWEQGVLDHVRIHECTVSVRKGTNSIRFYAGTRGIVLDKIVIAASKDAIKKSYFGPAENV